MNDPNGMFVDKNGTWHLYYQCEYGLLRLKSRKQIEGHAWCMEADTEEHCLL